MPRTPPLLLLLVLFAACATDSGDTVLVGDFGGDGLGLSASPASVNIEMPCNTRGTLPDPAIVGDDGKFSFETTVHQFYGDFEIYVDGRVVNGRLLEVRLGTEYSRPGSQPYVLVEGSEPDFSEYACLGASR